MVLASVFLVYKLAAEFLGTDGFSGYALSRRTTSLIQPALLMGFRRGNTKIYCVWICRPRSKKSRCIFHKYLFNTCSDCLFFLLFINLFNETFSFIFFGSSDYSDLVLPITYMIIGGIFIHHVIAICEAGF